MLDTKTFKTVISSAPLISLDFLVHKDNKILLGRRINKPAKGYLFTPGGRIHKNESIKSAMMRIAKDELNIKVEFIRVLRPERNLKDLEKLKYQIKKDISDAKYIIKQNARAS